MPNGFYNHTPEIVIHYKQIDGVWQCTLAVVPPELVPVLDLGEELPAQGRVFAVESLAFQTFKLDLRKLQQALSTHRLDGGSVREVLGLQEWQAVIAIVLRQERVKEHFVEPSAQSQTNAG